jgi:hypothetical protein
MTLVAEPVLYRFSQRSFIAQGYFSGLAKDLFDHDELQIILNHENRAA